MIFFHQQCIFFAPYYLSDLWNLGFLKACLASKNWAKEGIQHVSFFPILCNHNPHLIQWAHVFPSLLSVTGVFTEALFFLPLTSVARFDSIWASVFLAPSLHSWTCVCLTGYLSPFPLSVYFLFVFSFFFCCCWFIQVSRHLCLTFSLLGWISSEFRGDPWILTIFLQSLFFPEHPMRLF